MSLPLKRTLGEIRADIQTRLGFGMAGQAGIVNSGLIDSMIQSAQRQLYEQFDWLHLRGVEERSTGASQQFYDYPLDCNVERIQSITAIWSGNHIPLKEGIDHADRTWNPGGAPQKYERREQLELWPIPATTDYTLRIEYIKTLSRFTESSDRASLPDEIVFLHALSNAKAHYRQPDAQTYASQLDALLVKVKQRHRARTVYGKRTIADPYSYPPTSDQQILLT